MSSDVILFCYEPFILKYSVKIGRIVLARLSENCQKKGKPRYGFIDPSVDYVTFDYIFSPETSPEITVIPR